MPSQHQRSRLTIDELARVMGMLECGSSQRLWCESERVNQIMKSCPDVWLTHPACILISLTRFHKQTRLDCAQDHCNFTDNDWDHVLFTDEYRYCLDFTDRRAKVWRRRGE